VLPFDLLNFHLFELKSLKYLINFKINKAVLKRQRKLCHNWLLLMKEYCNSISSQNPFSEDL